MTQKSMKGTHPPTLHLTCFLVAAFLSLFAHEPVAGEGLYVWQVRGQGTIDAMPGNDYFVGPSIGYSNFFLFHHRLQLQASWLTNRLEAAWRLGVPTQDWVLFSPLWHWNRNGFFDPIFQMDMGFTWFDPEGLDIPHSDYILAPAFGFNLNLYQGRYGIQSLVGFQTHASSLVNPGMATVSFWGLW
jgi:hypothetical protein